MNHEYLELGYFIKENWFVLVAEISFFIGWIYLIIQAASKDYVTTVHDED